MGNEAQNFLPELTGQDGPQPGPSWQNARWPLLGADTEDDLTQALDPTTLKTAIKSAAAKAGKALDASAVEQAAGDSIRAMLLIRTYRVRGHLAADLDPLHLTKRELPADLTPEYYGFTGAALDRPIFLGGVLGLQWSTIAELVAILRKNYCGHVGLEYMHISDVGERRFLQERIEGPDKVITFTPEGKKAILSAVIRGEEYEKFLGKKFVGTKRFGLDGGESMIPALEAVIKYGGIPPYEETSVYVKRALTVYYGHPYGAAVMFAGNRRGGPLKGGFTRRVTEPLAVVMPGMRYLGTQ